MFFLVSQVRHDVNVIPIGSDKWITTLSTFKTGFNRIQTQGGVKYKQALQEARLNEAHTIIYIY